MSVPEQYLISKRVQEEPWQIVTTAAQAMVEAALYSMTSQVSYVTCRYDKDPRSDYTFAAFVNGNRVYHHSEDS